MSFREFKRLREFHAVSGSFRQFQAVQAVPISFRQLVSGSSKQFQGVSSSTGSFNQAL